MDRQDAWRCSWPAARWCSRSSLAVVAGVLAVRSRRRRPRELRHLPRGRWPSCAARWRTLARRLDAAPRRSGRAGPRASSLDHRRCRTPAPAAELAVPTSSRPRRVRGPLRVGRAGRVAGRGCSPSGTAYAARCRRRTATGSASRCARRSSGPAGSGAATSTTPSGTCAPQQSRRARRPQADAAEPPRRAVPDEPHALVRRRRRRRRLRDRARPAGRGGADPEGLPTGSPGSVSAPGCSPTRSAPAWPRRKTSCASGSGSRLMDHPSCQARWHATAAEHDSRRKDDD